jgi:hypothetical protein
MSVSLQEVLESAGYDIKNNPEDAMWLLAQKNEFEELYETAQETSDLYHDEYIDYTLSMDFTPYSFADWRRLVKEKEEE